VKNRRQKKKRKEKIGGRIEVMILGGFFLENTPCTALAVADGIWMSFWI